MVNRRGGNTISAAQWAQILGSWPALNLDASARAIGSRRYARLFWPVFIDEPWPGIDEPDEELVVLDRVGRWVVTESAILCLGQSAEIGLDRLNEADWYSHLLEKTWLYDPVDFLEILALARARQFPDESEDARQAAIERQVALARERAPLDVILPPLSDLHGHAYLVSHMTDEERAAFARFLAAQGFVPRTS